MQLFLWLNTFAYFWIFSLDIGHCNDAKNKHFLEEEKNADTQNHCEYVSVLWGKRCFEWKIFLCLSVYVLSICHWDGERWKIPCIVLLKKALQASQEATP